MIENNTVTTKSVNSQRRTFLGSALAALMAAPKLVKADDDKTESPNDPFILPLHGIYQPRKHWLGQPS